MYNLKIAHVLKQLLNQLEVSKIKDGSWALQTMNLKNESICNFVSSLKASSECLGHKFYHQVI